MVTLGPATLRSRLGVLCAGFGVLALAPVAMAWLSSHGPAPMAVSASAWSRLYFGHFVALVVLGYGLLFRVASKTKVFHEGPVLDFTVGLGLLVIASSFGRGWIPGLFLIGWGLRLMTGRALVARAE